MDIKIALAHVVDRIDLSLPQMQDVMRDIMTGQCTDAQIAAFIMGLRMKGESLDEIEGAVRIMRELMVPVHLGELRNVVVMERPYLIPSRSCFEVMALNEDSLLNGRVRSIDRRRERERED